MFFSEFFGSNVLVFLGFLEVREVLERSGRLKGTISFNLLQKRSGGFRVMSNKKEKSSSVDYSARILGGIGPRARAVLLMFSLSPTLMGGANPWDV